MKKSTKVSLKNILKKGISLAFATILISVSVFQMNVIPTVKAEKSNMAHSILPLSNIMSDFSKTYMQFGNIIHFSASDSDQCVKPVYVLGYTVRTDEKGHYLENITVGMATTPGATVYYTMDGTDPTEESEIFHRALHLEGTPGETVTYTFKAIAKKEGMRDSEISEHTFFISLPEHVHKWSIFWFGNSEFHWHNCNEKKCPITNNNEKDSYAPHTEDEGTVTKEPTYTETGIKTYRCSVCERVMRTEEIEKLEHKHSWNDTWSYDDSFHWYDCTAENCPITDNSEKDGYALHTEDEGTVTKEPTYTETGIRTYRCSVCGYEIRTEVIEELEHKHSWNDTWSYDNFSHWYDCTAENCPITDNSEKDGYALHTEDEGTVTKEPTYTETGIKTYRCSVCGYEIRTEVIEKLEPVHIHNWSDSWSYDDSSHWHNCTAKNCPVVKNSEKNGYASHTEDKGTVTLEPTKESTGIKTYRCSVCGYEIRTEVIPALSGDTNTTIGSNNTDKNINEPKTGYSSRIKIYQTILLMAVLCYLFLCLLRKISKERKEQLLNNWIMWAKKGSFLRRYLTLTFIFVFLAYYYSIGKQKTIEEYRIM